MQRAAQRAGCNAADIDIAIGQGCGWRSHDVHELQALRQFKVGLPVGSVLGHTGLAEAAGGLFSAIAAADSLRRGRFEPLATTAESFRPDAPAARGAVTLQTATGQASPPRLLRALLCGQTERGAAAALVLQRGEVP